MCIINQFAYENSKYIFYSDYIYLILTHIIQSATYEIQAIGKGHGQAKMAFAVKGSSLFCVLV
jgi:hypothetical protein